MAQKDKIEKILEDYNDVFADIYNTLLFKKLYLQEDKLLLGPTESIYKAEKGELKNQFRDMSKYYEEGGIVLATLGIENQAEVENYISVRVMGYDYGSYKGQLGNKKPLTPVITIVLNFANEKWNKPKSIWEEVSIADDLKEYVQNYRVEVFDIAFLEDEVINSFTSDFGIVARFFKEKRLKEDGFVLSDDMTEIKHVEAVLNLLTVFTKDTKYEEIYLEHIRAREVKGEKITMCKVADAYINKGRQSVLEEMTEGLEKKPEGEVTMCKVADAYINKGRQSVLEEMTEGLKEKPEGEITMCKVVDAYINKGRQSVLEEMAKKLYNNGMSLETIEEITGLDMDTIKVLCEIGI